MDVGHDHSYDFCQGEFKSSHVRRPLPWGAGGTAKEPPDPLSLSYGSPGCLELTASLLIAPQCSGNPEPPPTLGPVENLASGVPEGRTLLCLSQLLALRGHGEL